MNTRRALWILLQSCKTALFLSASFALVAVGVTSIRVGIDLHEAIHTNSQLSQDSLKAIQPILKNLDDASQAWKKASDNEITNLNKTGEDVRRVITHFDRVLTAQNLNLTKTLDQQNKNLTDVARNVNLSLGEIPPTLRASQTLLASTNTTVEKLQDPIQSVNRVLSDPAITQTLGHVNNTASHLENTSASVDKAVERMTKPKSMFKSALTWILGISTDIARIVK